ncbi:hypothetical protein, partial [Pseudarthrobacter oxydans]|uniref:hypothetical protein n=1 Tax=Pseudarthrobacter oxydans TaxID=1671 RepID=UPI00286A9FCF
SSSRASAITTKTSPHILEGSRNGYTTPRDLTGVIREYAAKKWHQIAKMLIAHGYRNGLAMAIA